MMTKDIDVRLTTIQLPIQVLDHIDSYKNRYTSRTDIVIEALEDWLEKKSGIGIPRTQPPIKEPAKWLVQQK